MSHDLNDHGRNYHLDLYVFICQQISWSLRSQRYKDVGELGERVTYIISNVLGVKRRELGRSAHFRKAVL